MMKAKDLKNSILQLAVEGKLVPQDPSDEPASVLLERIREQKHRLIAEGKAKFPKGGESVIFVGSDGLPYEKLVDAKGNCLDSGATEQVFGHLKDEFFRGRDWDDFENLKADLEAYIIHRNTRRRQVRLKGLTPAEFRNQALQKAA